ncbi:MAG TPA: DUF3418 domain-containing protein, partial [Steroidobacteraceae bacterium]|nr:DUF3418 domain-containing protein [Steroidobacteraceae bacterium]
LRQEIERLEAKIRRRDILADEARQVEFYAARIPEQVSSVASFEQWRAHAERQNPNALVMSPADLMLREATEVDRERFPDELEIGGNRLPLEYRLEPGEADDGVTLGVPDLLLDALQADQIAWLVPGWRLEKIIAVLRELPKTRRKLLVPVPEHARQALAELTARGTHVAHGGGTVAGYRAGQDALPGFYAGLAAWVSERIGAPVVPAELAALPLPDWLRMNIRVVDEQDRVLAMGRDLAVLRRKMPGTAASARPAAEAAPVMHRQWEFGELPESRTIERNRLLLTVFPALEDCGSGVVLVEARSPPAAEEMSRRGVGRLSLLALPQQARYWQKRVSDDRELVLQSRGLDLVQPLPEAIAQRIFLDSFVPGNAPLPRGREAFNRRLEEGRARLEGAGTTLIETVGSIFREWRAVRSALEAARSPASANALADINTQLAMLLPPDFIESTPHPWLGHVPRYLMAVVRRLGRLPAGARRDEELAARVHPFGAALRELLARAPSGMPQPELMQLRWMVEEFRVSLFAQDLRTVMRVSEPRLAEQLEKAQAQARQ